MPFADHIVVLVGDSKSEINKRLEKWRQILETCGFHINRSKKKFMNANLVEGNQVDYRNVVKLGNHHIQEVVSFKFLTIQNKGEIEEELRKTYDSSNE